MLCIWSTFRRVCLAYSPEQYKHPASISELSSPLSTRLDSSQSSESNDDYCLYLKFNTNDWNICVTGTALSLLLLPYFGRFPPISSHLAFVSRARQNSSKSFSFSNEFLLAVLVSCQRYLEQDWFQRAGQQQWVLCGRRSDCWLGSVDLCR